MQIDIQARKLTLTAALRRHVERRLRFVANARYDDIGRILVRLSDVNGPRGGQDKCCLIQVQIPGASDVVIADTRSNCYAAISRAAGRLSQALSRRLTRQRNRWRQNARTGDDKLMREPGLSMP